MISNKALATLFLITLNMQRAACSNTQEPDPSGKSAPLKRKRIPAPKPREVLQDINSSMNPVEVPGGSIEVTSTLQEQPSFKIKMYFKALIEKGEYKKIFEIGKQIGDEEFLKQLCPVIETLGQYNGIVGYLKRHNMVASFYVFGKIEIIRGTIVELRIYDEQSYLFGGNLEKALPLALEKDCHDRFMELLDVRMGITAERDKRERGASFGSFVYLFLRDLAPERDGMALKRFLTFSGEELRNKYPDIFDTLCGWLMYHLSDKLDLPKAEGLLIDLIGLPSLLTPAVFAEGFLCYYHDERRSAFIKHGWRETIEEGLKTKCRGGGKELWLVMQKEQPSQFPGEFPATEEARAAACMCFPTKQQKEEQWIEENVPDFWKDFEIIFASIRFPTVLTKIVIEYAATKPTWIDIETAATKPTWIDIKTCMPTSIWKKFMKRFFG